MFILSVTSAEELLEALGPLFEIQGKSSIHYGRQTGMKLQSKNERVVAEVSMTDVPRCILNTDEEDGALYLDLDQLWLVLKSCKSGELKLIFQNENMTLKIQHASEKVDKHMKLNVLHDSKWEDLYHCHPVEGTAVMLSEDFKITIEHLVDLERFADVTLSQEGVELSTFTAQRIFKVTEGTTCSGMIKPTRFRLYEEEAASILSACVGSHTVDFTVPVENTTYSCRLQFKGGRTGAVYQYVVLR